MRFNVLVAISFLLISTLTGCLYKMPDDNCVCTLPNTNNPSLIREVAPALIPGRG